MWEVTDESVTIELYHRELWHKISDSNQTTHCVESVTFSLPEPKEAD